MMVFISTHRAAEVIYNENSFTGLHYHGICDLGQKLTSVLEEEKFFEKLRELHDQVWGSILPLYKDADGFNHLASILLNRKKKKITLNKRMPLGFCTIFILHHCSLIGAKLQTSVVGYFSCHDSK